MKKVVFITGTRADYGKIKPLIKVLKNNEKFEVSIFVTGMHMLSQYGSTFKEIQKDEMPNLFMFVNQKENQSMDITLSNTIIGISNYVSEFSPDMIVIHGDRVEALAGAIVGAFNNVRVVHIEGGEVSGTIDESIRHAITKLAHIHMVANDEAKRRIIQLGEEDENIYVIGSPDIDVMFSLQLPNIENVKEHYQIPYDEYAIFMYHPVTTEVKNIENNIKTLLRAIEKTNQNYVVIYPNNDMGSNVIINNIDKLSSPRFRVYPSIRFECFLTLLKHSKFIIGNSSAGIREASVYGIPVIDIGTRQFGRYDVVKAQNIIHVNEAIEDIINAIKAVHSLDRAVEKISLYGCGNSAQKFLSIFELEKIWKVNCQKTFVDIV